MDRAHVFKMGLVGCGDISRLHAEAVRAIPGLRFTACCDVREDAARAWMAEYGCDAWYTDYATMIRKENLDGVLIATWPNLHREHVEGCLAAGAKNILCEKALTLTGSDALAIYRSVQEAGAYVMEGFMYRHHPLIRKIEHILKTGELGAVDNVRACFGTYDPEDAAPDDINRNWRQREECGGGMPYDYACYCVNACRNFTGGIPVRVYCRGDLSPKYHVINRMYALIEYDNGCIGIIESSKKASMTQELQVTCAQGILNAPAAWTLHDDIVLTKKHNRPNPVPNVDTYHIFKVNPYQLQMENFVAVAQGKSEPVMALAESVINTFTIEALVTSLQERRVVDVHCPEEIVNAL